jgi:RNA polymerase sigma factor (sigma-70 family)
MRTLAPAVLRYLEALYGDGALGGCSDGQLLERLTATRTCERTTEIELAFAALVERHGAMVWRVCRTFALNEHDAEDAFQATFLVLIRKAKKLRVRQTLGPWLHAVASRISMGVRAESLRRRRIERTAGIEALIKSGCASGESENELDEMGISLQEEITRLPERFRAAVVLCDLGGLSYREAAEKLEIPLGTLQSRLARGRERLRRRLESRGYRPIDRAEGSNSATVLVANGSARLIPSLALQRTTCRQCLALSAAPHQLHTLVSSSLRALIQKSSKPMLLSRWNGVAIVPMAAMILCAGMLLDDSTKAKPVQDEGQPAKAATPATAPVASNPVSTKRAPLVVPAPLEANATAGRGRALVYALDQNGERATMPPVASKRRRRQGGEMLLEAPAKEIVVEVSWVVITGVVPHHLVIQNRLNAGLKSGSISPERLYRRVDLERAERLQDNAWSDWRAVDAEPTMRILDNMPEVEAEKTPDEVRFDTLVDPLPFLKVGAWNGVDVDRFVRKANENGAGQPPVIVGGRMKGGGRPAKPTPAPPVLMLRQLDFSVERGRTYRYRARLVVEEERGRKKEVAGPWSESTLPVTVP